MSGRIGSGGAGPVNNQIPGASEHSLQNAESALADMPADWVVGGDPNLAANKGINRPTNNKNKTQGAGLQEQTFKMEGAGGDPFLPEGADEGSVADAQSFLGAITVITGGEGGGFNAGEIGGLLLAVLKDAIKDKNAAEKISGALKDASLASKKATLKKENESIDEGMKEAKEKAQIMMNQATLGLVMGVCAGALQLAGGAMSFAGAGAKADAAKLSDGGTEGAAKAGHLNTAKWWDGGATLAQTAGGILQSTSSYMSAKAQADALEVDANSKSSKAKIDANILKMFEAEAERRAEKADDNTKTAKEFLKSTMDAFKKYTEQMKELRNATDILR